MQKLIEFIRILVLPRCKLDTNWEWHESYSGIVMRRRINGKWEMRPMTPDEQQEYMGSRIGW